MGAAGADNKDANDAASFVFLSFDTVRSLAFGSVVHARSANRPFLYICLRRMLLRYVQLLVVAWITGIKFALKAKPNMMSAASSFSSASGIFDGFELGCHVKSTHHQMD